MEGYRLTTKGFITIALLFFVVFITPAALIMLLGGQVEEPPGGYPVDPVPVDSASPLSTDGNTPGTEESPDMAPSPQPPGTPETLTSPDTSPVPTAGTSPDASPSISPPPDSPVSPFSPVETMPEPTNAVPLATPNGGKDLPPDPPPEVTPAKVGLELSFAYSGKELSPQSREQLRTYLETIPDPRKSDSTLVIEGRAYIGEADDENAVAALAGERMRAVLEYLQPLAAGINILPVSTVRPAVSADSVPGAYLYIIRKKEK